MGECLFGVDGDVTGLAGTVTLPGGDMKLRATVSDTSTSVKYGPSLNCISLSLEKPDSFILNYIPADKDVKFQFVNKTKLIDKPLNLTYTYSRGANRTVLDGTMVIDPSNKLSINHAIGSDNFKLKYNYLHKGNTTGLRVSHDDVVRESYQSSSKILGLEYHMMIGVNGTFKVYSSVNLAEPLTFLKLSGKSTLSFEV